MEMARALRPAPLSCNGWGQHIIILTLGGFFLDTGVCALICIVMLQPRPKESSIVNTAFKTFAKLLDLARATSEDEVSPDAVLASESFGTDVIVPDSLTAAANDALARVESSWLADTLLSFGLAQADTAKQIRTSKAGVSAFVLISALRVVYDQETIGDVLFEFLTISRNGHVINTSAKQLDRLVSALASYGEELLISIVQSQASIAEALESIPDGHIKSASRSYWARLYPKEMAKLLKELFDAVRDEDCDYIELSGQRGLVWIATMLKWFYPDEFGLFFRGNRINGVSDGRVRIEVANAPDIEWTQLLWKAGQSTLSTISPDSTDGEDSRVILRPKVDRRQTRHYIAHTQEYSPNGPEMALIGALAAAIVDSILKEGLNPPMLTTEFHHGPDHCVRRCQLSHFMTPAFTQKAGMSIEAFGWNMRERWVMDARAHFSRHMEQRHSKHVLLSPTGLLGEEPPKIIQRPEISIDMLWSLAAPIAGQALVSGNIEFDRVTPYYLTRMDCKWIWLLLNPKSSLSLADWQKYCWMVATSTTVVPTDNLIVSQEGRVIFPQVAVDSSTSLRSILNLRVIPGRIRYKYDIYDSVEETYTGNESLPSRNEHEWPKVMNLSKNNDTDNLRPPMEQPTELLVYFARKGNKLLLKSSVLSKVSNDRRWKCGVTYHETIKSLAFATHITRVKPQLPLKKVRAELKKSGLEAVINVSCAERGRLEFYPLKDPIYVTCEPSSPCLRFFNAHPNVVSAYTTYLSSAPRVNLYVQQEGASFIECLNEIQKSNRRTEIIMTTGLDNRVTTRENKQDILLLTGQDAERSWNPSQIEEGPSRPKIERDLTGKKVLVSSRSSHQKALEGV